MVVAGAFASAVAALACSENVEPGTRRGAVCPFGDSEREWAIATFLPAVLLLLAAAAGLSRRGMTIATVAIIALNAVAAAIFATIA